jgi:hypothetical protein
LRHLLAYRPQPSIFHSPLNASRATPSIFLHPGVVALSWEQSSWAEDALWYSVMRSTDAVPLSVLPNTAHLSVESKETTIQETLARKALRLWAPQETRHTKAY